MTTNIPGVSELRGRLAKVGQEHLLAFHDSLSPGEQEALRAQIAGIDLEAVPGWVAQYVKGKPAAGIPADHAKIRPALFHPYEGRPGVDVRAAREAGEALLRGGKVAAFVVAGGQGSRLGFEGPKGCYPATPITKKPLFQVFAEQLLAARRAYGAVIPWYIMTSPLNHTATVKFFEDHRYFGLGKGDVKFFQQGVMPSFDMATGRILLAGKGEVATNPDGHGGAVAALHKSGALEDMRRRGVTQLSYFQVDNPHVKVCDPVFLGVHVGAGALGGASSGEMSSKMIPKAAWDEKVGVFCQVERGGVWRLDVIEYSDMPAELARAANADGSLKFAAGSIAIHIISVAFLGRLATDPKFGLPFHRAEKKIGHVDPATGAVVSPAANNGVKLERFIFDALAMARSSVVYETDRVEEFAPIKNAVGVDSVESSQKLQTARAARWLEGCGTAVPRNAAGEPDCVIELSPLTAACRGDVSRTSIPKAIGAGESLVL